MPATASTGGEARQVTSGAPIYAFSWTRDAKIVMDSGSDLDLLDPESGSMTRLVENAGIIISGPSCLSLMAAMWFLPGRLARGRRSDERLARGRLWWEP